MPSVESRVRARLYGNPAVSALVSRVYAGYAQQGAELPYIVVQRVSGSPFQTLGGQNANKDNEARFQVDCIATDYGHVKNIATAARAALDGWTDSGAGITSCRLDNEQDDTETPEDASNVVAQRVIQDYIVFWQ